MGKSSLPGRYTFNVRLQGRLTNVLCLDALSRMEGLLQNDMPYVLVEVHLPAGMGYSVYLTG